MKDDLLKVISLQFATRDGITPADIVEGRAPFTDPWFKDSLTVLKEMYDKGYLPKNFWTIGGTDGRMSYATGKMPQKFGYYWDVDTHKEMGMPYEIQAVASMPDFTNGKASKPYKIMGVSSFMVSKKTKYADTVIDFLKFMTNEENQDDLAYKYFGKYPNGMPVVNKNVKLSDYAMQYMNDISTGIGTPYSFMDSSLKSKEIIDATLPLFMEGKITLDQAALEFDKLRAK
jgi:ABC-type glycerol-3-phosphate transport system substrate-binding protein